MEQMRTAKKIMMVRTILNPSAPRTTDIYKIITQIMNFHAAKVSIHPTDSKRILRALRYFVEDVNIDRVNELLITQLHSKL
jgi:16S rRNA C1402 N4-methylase RsmH